MAMRNTNI